MTPEAQRIAIAEACGWRHVRDLGVGLPGPMGHHPERILENEPKVQFMESVPDFLNDLNAMHEAEKVLSLGGRTQYIFILQTICGGQQFGDNYFATAAQRSEAFLRTLNLWKD